MIVLIPLPLSFHLTFVTNWKMQTPNLITLFSYSIVLLEAQSPSLHRTHNMNHRTATVQSVAALRSVAASKMRQGIPLRCGPIGDGFGSARARRNVW